MATSSRPSSFVFTSPGPLRLFSTVELLRLPPPEWLVDGVIPAGGLIGLYGQPGTGKSFVAIDLALAIATGRPWQGFPVQRGFVVYVSAEGGTGIGKRVLAWLKEYSVPPIEANIAWLTESVSVHNDSEGMELLMDRLTDEVQLHPSLIVVDTLARCFDGDENQQEDMGRFIGGIDRLRREFGATVLVVHHTRLGGDRERGNTAFRGAADTMISVERNKGDSIITFENNKQKDSEEFSPLSFRLKPVADADPRLSSCIVEPTQRRHRQIALRALAEAPGEGATFTYLVRVMQDEGHVSLKTAKRMLVTLVENGEIIKENGTYLLNRGHGKEHRDP